MKNIKILSVALLCVFAIPAIAQEATETVASEEEVSEYLPQAGDWGVTFDVSPLLNVFAGVPTDGLDGGAYNSNITSIGMKYMMTNNFAFRANIGWIYNLHKENGYATDDLALMKNPLSQQKVTDSYIYRTSGASITLGAEYRVGKGRVQGIFGGGLTYGLSYRRVNYKYGNAMTTVNQVPSVADPSEIDASGIIPSGSGITTARYLKNRSRGSDHYFGAVCYVGIEWFVAKRISLGAEVNLSILGAWESERWATAEGYNKATNKVEQWTELQKPQSTSFHFGTENIGANINMNFYF